MHKTKSWSSNAWFARGVFRRSLKIFTLFQIEMKKYKKKKIKINQFSTFWTFIWDNFSNKKKKTRNLIIKIPSRDIKQLQKDVCEATGRSSALLIKFGIIFFKEFSSFLLMFRKVIFPNKSFQFIFKKF